MAKPKERASGSGANMSASSSVDLPSVVTFQGGASALAPTPVSTALPKKKGGMRARFSLQRLLYSPLLNRRRKNSQANGSGKAQQASVSSASHINNNYSNRGGGSTKTSASKASFDDCHFRYGAVGQRDGAGTSSMVGCDSLSAASFSSSSCDQKRDKVAGGQECPFCLLYVGPDRLLTLTNCHHVACKECLAHYVHMAISEYQGNFHCFECSEFMHPSDVKALMKKDSYVVKYEDLMLRRVLASDPDTRWCPAPDCSYAVIAAGCASCPRLKCDRPGCGTNFCYHCKAEWHPNQTCDAARAEREPRFRASSLSFSYDFPYCREQIKPCPVCRSLIMKQEDGSCNHMVCSVCATEFCWLCMKQISDLHYLSPSGCTFWGKKPWSRKKKIMWQLGMLIGAPVGIALIAGIAVPAIVIGIPVWVARRIYQNANSQTRHRRNVIILGGVLASVLVSPVLAGAAVGIGVPMLLAYVYGVVPVSLCRSGVCGISTSASGVRLDFDEDDENQVNDGDAEGRLGKLKKGEEEDDEEEDDASSSRGRLASGAGGALAGEGSSVGPGMSMTLSLGDGSSCHTVDRHVSDETASLKALAGSIASSASRGQRMEVMADVTSHAGKRNSISSESVSGVMSMISSSDRHSDGRSGVVAVSEDRASNVALAGSILSYRLNTEQGYQHAGVEVVSLKSIDAVGSSSRGGGGGTNASVSPVSSFSTGDELFFGRRSAARNSARKGYLERQLSLDSGSLEERVRFDENVSFIDDHHGDGQILEDVEAEELEARFLVDANAPTRPVADLEKLLVRIRDIAQETADAHEEVAGEVESKPETKKSKSRKKEAGSSSGAATSAPRHKPKKSAGGGKKGDDGEVPAADSSSGRHRNKEPRDRERRKSEDVVARGDAVKLFVPFPGES